MTAADINPMFVSEDFVELAEEINDLVGHDVNISVTGEGAAIILAALLRRYAI